MTKETEIQFGKRMFTFTLVCVYIMVSLVYIVDKYHYPSVSNQIFTFIFLFNQMSWLGLMLMYNIMRK